MSAPAPPVTVSSPGPPLSVIGLGANASWRSVSGPAPPSKFCGIVISLLPFAMSFWSSSDALIAVGMSQTTT